MDDRSHNTDDLMENKAAFDLNQEIRRWKEKLAESPGFRNDDLDELECHVQDSVGDLQSRGLSAEEAFTIAVRRVGHGMTLAAEFGSINNSHIWIDRLLWMLIGWASVSIVQSLLSSIALALVFPNGLRGFLPAVIQVLPLILAALMLGSLVRADGRASRLMTRLLCKPISLSLVFFGIGLASVLLRLLAGFLIVGRLLQPAVAGFLVSIVPWVIVALIILILAEKRRRPLRA